jgi:hypothetical protein
MHQLADLPLRQAAASRQPGSSVQRSSSTGRQAAAGPEWAELGQDDGGRTPCGNQPPDNKGTQCSNKAWENSKTEERNFGRRWTTISALLNTRKLKELQRSQTN